MGFEVVAIARGADKAPLARELGAHDYVDSAASDAAEMLARRRLVSFERSYASGR